MIPASLYAVTTRDRGARPSPLKAVSGQPPEDDESMGKPAYANAIHPADTQNAVRIVPPL